MNQEQAQRKKAANHAETDARHQYVEELGDFTTTLRVLPISGLAIVIGAVCAVLALVLLRLIGLFTNLFYFGRWSTTMASPVGNHLGIHAVFVPVVGALVIGVMARYGSERIRGHGIPEARLLPVIDTNGRLVGVITRGEIRAQMEKFGDDVLGKRLEEIMRPHTIEVYPDEPLRAAVYRMAEKGVTRMPVVSRESRQLRGLISLDDLLKARTRHLEEERRRERTIQVQNYFPGNRSNRKPPEVEASAETS